MSWVAVGASVAGAAAGSMLSKGGSSGGGSTQTVDKTPWAAAVPWLTNNLQTGQNLQSYYQQNPFNALQQGAYQNLFAGNDYINKMTPGMLSQLSQSQGFDRTNPRARPQVMQFPQMQASQFPQMSGLLGGGQSSGGGMMGAPMSGGMNQTQNPFANGLLPSSPAAAAPTGPVVAPGSLLNYGSGNPYATYDPSGGGGGGA